MSAETVTLWRPVGAKELELIRAAGMRAFPPRLPEQPIFYPVLSEDYAIKIARDWNVPHDGAGFVTGGSSLLMAVFDLKLFNQARPNSANISLDPAGGPRQRRLARHPAPQLSSSSCSSHAGQGIC